MVTDAEGVVRSLKIRRHVGMNDAPDLLPFYRMLQRYNRREVKEMACEGGEWLALSCGKDLQTRLGWRIYEVILGLPDAHAVLLDTVKEWGAKHLVLAAESSEELESILEKRKDEALNASLVVACVLKGGAENGAD